MGSIEDFAPAKVDKAQRSIMKICSNCKRDMEGTDVYCSPQCKEVGESTKKRGFIDYGIPKQTKDGFSYYNSLMDRGRNLNTIKYLRINFPATISPRQAVELLTNGCCGD